MPRGLETNSTSAQLLQGLLKNSLKSMGSGVFLIALGYFIYEKYINKRQRQTCYQSFSRLKRRGYIASRKSGQTTYYSLTAAGRQAATTLLNQINQPAPPQPKLWDGKWRILCFDIPEYRRHDRALLRQLIYRYHFRKYQASVWITPYDHLNAIKKAVAQAKLSPYVQTLTAFQIDRADHYQKLFKLSHKK